MRQLSSLRAPLLTIALLAVGAARADDARLPDDAEGAKPRAPYKLTAGAYRFDDRSAGTDLNLRRGFEHGNGWLGYYRDPSFGGQLRAGADASIKPFETIELALQPSVQLASRGFVGASLTLEYGVPWFASAGIGRTNLRPYWNLNFDPNDALSVASGYRGRDGFMAYLQAIRDDRLGSGQQHVHAVLRLPLGRDRLLIDVLRKQGQGEPGYVRAWGVSIGYDWPRVFIRIARDPNVNFTADKLTRVSVGLRF